MFHHMTYLSSTAAMTAMTAHDGHDHRRHNNHRRHLLSRWGRRGRCRAIHTRPGHRRPLEAHRRDTRTPARWIYRRSSEAKTSAITILPTVELNFLTRVFDVLIVTFHSWSDSLSHNRVCCLDVVAVAIICPLPLTSCGRDGGIRYQHSSSERPTCWRREPRRPG